MILIVMGVSGSGKSTFGTALAAALGWDFIEGDDFHSAENRAKMAAGIALSDADRQPWLADISRRLKAYDRAGRSSVLCCSALKQSYRATLADGLSGIYFIYLRTSPKHAAWRVAHRRGHFISPSLVASQFATLEEPTLTENILTIDSTQTLDEKLSRVLSALQVKTTAP